MLNRGGWHHQHMAKPSQSSPDLLSALTRARMVAEDHMTGANRVGISWREETISELLWVNAQPFVRCADFSRHEENVVGADWLWWWVDDRGECFGMLVQAKRLHHREGQPQLDFRHNGGQQMTRLFSVADRLQVPAVYALYFGGIEFHGMRCGKRHTSNCARCRRASISMITALQAELASGSGPCAAASLAFKTRCPWRTSLTRQEPTNRYTISTSMRLSRVCSTSCSMSRPGRGVWHVSYSGSYPPSRL